MTALRILLTGAACLAALAACDSGQPGHVQGYVEGEYLRMSAPAGGWVETLAVARGQQVAADAPLFTLDATQERAALAEARARLAQAQAQRDDLAKGGRPEEIAAAEAEVSEARAALRFARAEEARQEALARTDVGARQRLEQARSQAQQAEAQVASLQARLATVRLPARADQLAAAEAAVEAARSAVAQADWRLGQRTVTAPKAGMVEDTVRLEGEWAAAGQTVVSLLPPEQVKVRLFVPERLLSSLRLGQTVGVACDGCPAGLAATVSFIAPQAEFTPPVIYSIGSREKLVFLVEARPAPGVVLHPGQPVDIALAPAGAPVRTASQP
jgi:HlyD family secretion protein